MKKYVSKRKPREHQAEVLDKLKGRKSFAILLGMRMGKTKTVVDDWGRLVSESAIRDLMVVAPAGAYMPWADAIKDDLPSYLYDETYIFVWTSKKSKTKAFKQELIHFLNYSGPRVLLMNVEALSAVLDARALAATFLRDGKLNNMLVIDESVVIKNHTSACSKFCVDVLSPLAGYKRILSGLVSPRSPLDVYQQFRFLDKKIFPETYDQFRDKYAKVKRICSLPSTLIRNKYINALRLNSPTSYDQLCVKAKMIWPDMEDFPEYAWLHKMVMDSPNALKRDEMVNAIFRAGKYIQSIPIIEGYKNVEELHNRIAEHSFRARLEDCFDMPPIDYSFYDVEMHPDQERIYAEMREFAIAQIEEDQHVSAANVISQMLRLHQVLCGHTRTEDGTLIRIPEYRTNRLLEILTSYDGKAIIWCSYDADIRKVQEALEKEFGEGSVARFWGGNRSTREEEEKVFKLDPTCRFMVATPDAGGRGRTWDVADLTIYYSSKDNLDHRAQSEDRVKAVGKTRPLVYIDLRVKGTVEDKIIKALREKINLADVISGDDYRGWLI